MTNTWASRLYRYVTPIPAAELENVPSYPYTPDERLAMLDSVAAKEMGHQRAMIEVAAMWQSVLDRNNAVLEQRHTDLLRRYGASRKQSALVVPGSRSDGTPDAPIFLLLPGSGKEINDYVARGSHQVEE